MDSSPQTVSLVLGSGGARGLAHIGVIHELEARGLDIRAIAGSSMGALIGGMYAMGELETYSDWVNTLDQADVLRLLDWTLSGGGLIRGRKIIDKLRELVGERNIEDLPIDYTAVAVDLDRGREIWLTDGPLFDAIRASIAIPGLFTPHRYGKRTLIDGGILNPVPVAPTLRTMTDRTIVVDVNAPVIESTAGVGQSEQHPHRTGNSSLAKVREFVDRFARDENPADNQPGMTAVLLQSLETMQSVITRQHLAVFHPDVVIQVPKNACMVHEFHRAGELIELGRRLAAETLDSVHPERHG